MKAKLYHVASKGLRRGHVVEPGGYGAQVRIINENRFLTDANNSVIFGWEIALELSRQLYAPTKPSRLNCVFVCADLASATSFRDKFRRDCPVYEAEVTTKDVARHIGAFDLLDAKGMAGRPFVDGFIEIAKTYWLSSPTNGVVIEHLIGGPIRLIKSVS